MSVKENDFSGIPGIEIGGADAVAAPVDSASALSEVALAAGGEAPGGVVAAPGGDVAVAAESPARTPEQARASYRRFLLMAMRFFFGVITPNWKVTEEEIKTLADLWVDALMELWPEGLPFNALAEACVGTGDFLTSRLGVPRKTAEQENDKRAWWKIWEKTAA